MELKLHCLCGRGSLIVHLVIQLSLLIFCLALQCSGCAVVISLGVLGRYIITLIAVNVGIELAFISPMKYGHITLIR